MVKAHKTKNKLYLLYYYNRGMNHINKYLLNNNTLTMLNN